MILFYFQTFAAVNFKLNEAVVVKGLWKQIKAGETWDGVTQTEPSAEESGEKRKLDDGDLVDVNPKSKKMKNTEKSCIKNPDKSNKKNLLFSDLAEEHLEEKYSSNDVVESKSARRKRRKIEQSSTEEPLLKSLEDNRDFGDMEAFNVDTMDVVKHFKWRSTLKSLLANGPPEGTHITRLLNQVEQLHNHPLHGAEKHLPKETLHNILVKTLSKKPFSIKNNRAKKGSFLPEKNDD